MKEQQRKKRTKRNKNLLKPKLKKMPRKRLNSRNEKRRQPKNSKIKLGKSINFKP